MNNMLLFSKILLFLLFLNGCSFKPETPDIIGIHANKAIQKMEAEGFIAIYPVRKDRIFKQHCSLPSEIVFTKARSPDWAVHADLDDRCMVGRITLSKRKTEL